MAPRNAASLPWTSRLVMSVSRSAFDVAAGLVGVGRARGLHVGQTPLRIRAGDGGSAGRFRTVSVGLARACGIDRFGRQVALLVALGKDLDREIRAVPLAQATAD